MRFLLAIVLLPFCAPALAARCELGGVEVNTDNGATTAGKSGILKCYKPDGKLWREQELRDGKYLGLDKRYDDDGAVSERQVNANGNTDGLAREWYPGGKLKREARYENGSVVGVSRAFHPDGKPASLRFTQKAGANAAVTLEWNAQGAL